MPTITIRVSATEKAVLDASASNAGQTLSDYVRETLTLREQRDHLDALNASVGALTRRMARLEQLANLD